MWCVVYFRRYLRFGHSETFRYQSKYWLKAFLVYLGWRVGYTLAEHEVRNIKFYRVTKDNLIILDAHRTKRRY